MTDLVTNAYGKTDAFGKGNLANVIGGSAGSDSLKDFYKTHYKMTDADWVSLFGENNVIYKNDSNTVFSPVSLLNQTTIKNDNIDLFTADIVLQVMKKLEKAIQTTSFVHTQYKALEDSLYTNNSLGLKMYHMLNMTSFGTPQVNLFNEYVINQILTTRIKRRYVIVQSTASVFSMSEIEIFDHEKNKITVTESQITVSSEASDTHRRNRLVDGNIPGGVMDAWSTDLTGESDAPSLVPNTEAPGVNKSTHHIIIDLGSSQDIGKVVLHSKNEAADANSGGNFYNSDIHSVFLTDHLYWRHTLEQPFTPPRTHNQTFISMYNDLQPQPLWISDKVSTGSSPTTAAGMRQEWQYNPSPPHGSQTVFTYVFDGHLDPAFKQYGTGEFRVHMDGDDWVHLYVNGNPISPPLSYTGSIGHVKTIQTNSEVNRFDFVVQNTNQLGSSTAGLLATVDYKTLALPLKKHRYVYVQLDDPEEAGKWAEIKVFDENNALLTPSSSMVAPFDGTGGLHHDGNLLTFSDTTDSSTIASAYYEIYEQVDEDIDGESENDNSGKSVATNGDGTIIVIGTPKSSGTSAGKVRVYNYASASNTLTQIGEDINGEENNHQFGSCVSISNDGTIVAIGSGDFRGGGERVYKWMWGTWTQLGTDFDPVGISNGSSVSLSADGTVLAIGSSHTARYHGHTRMYKYASNAWTQLGTDIRGENSGDYSGQSVSLSADGTIVAIGAPYNDGGDSNSGHTRVYKYDSNKTSANTLGPAGWDRLGEDIDGVGSSDYSGSSVSLSSDGTILAIGAPGNDGYNGNTPDSGATHIYKYTSNVWTQHGPTIYGERGDKLGTRVSLSSDGSTLAIGSPYNGGERNGRNVGCTQIYKYASNEWIQEGKNILGGGDYEYSGWSLSLSGDGSTLAIGAPFKNLGYTRVYKSKKIALPTHKTFLESTKFERSSNQGAWAMVDLGDIHTISKIELYGVPEPYTYTSTPQISSHTVYLKGSDSNYSEIIQLKSGDSSIPSVHTFTDTVVDPETQTQTSTTTTYNQAFSTYNISRSISEGTFESMYATTELGPIQQWGRAFATGTDGWTISEAHQTMVGSDTIQLPSLSAIHKETLDRSYRQAIYNFPSSSTDPIIDMGGTPVSFTVEHITKYQYVIVQLGSYYKPSHWSAIEAYDENGDMIEVASSGLSHPYSNNIYPSTLHHDGDMTTFSHTTGGRWQLEPNGYLSGPWSMIRLAKLSTITEIRVISRNYTGDDRLERRTPFKVYLTDTFIDYKVGDNTFEIWWKTRDIVSQVGEQFTYVFTNVPSHYPNDLSWEITQDTDSQIVASSEQPSQSTLPQPNTVYLDEKHLGYTGSYTFTMRDSTAAWDTYYQMNVTSLDIHGRSTVRKVTRRDSINTTTQSLPLNGQKVVRMPLNGDTTPLRTTLWREGQIYWTAAYLNKLKHIKSLLKDKSQIYEPYRNHIINIYDTAIEIEPYTVPTTSEFWWPERDNAYYNKMWSARTIISDILTKAPTNLILHDLFANMYDIHFNDDTDISMYELQPKDNPTYTKFTDNKILFTSRLGYAARYKVETLAHYLNETAVRNGIPLSQFASEMAVEMLQNSSLKSFASDDTSLSQLPMSCGYEIVTDKDDVTNVLNVRIYVSHIIDHPFEEGKQLAISSGVNLFDFVNIKKFSKGISSSNFITHLTETIQTLNSDPFANFNETAYTTWEYGTPAEYDSLKCVSSPNADYWTGKLIKDCQLKGSTEDVPKRIFFILDYINTHYVDLYNNQYIIINDINGIGKVVSVIRITIADDDKITFQSRDSHIDYLFPIANVNADMVVNGELQVANYKGDVLLHVDPVTDKSMLMGKLGINQEMHDIHAMLDIDNLSNKNLLDFSKRFMPLILDSVTKMDTFITYNPYNDNPTTKVDKTAAILELKVYTSMPATVEPSRLERFGTLQARVELPVRIYVVIAAYRTLHDLDDVTVEIRVHYDRCFGHQKSLEKRLEYHEKLLVKAKEFKAAAAAKEKEEAENMSIWARIAEAALNIAVALLPGAAMLMQKVIFGATGFDVSDSIESLADTASSEAWEAHIVHLEADIEQNEEDLAAATTRTDEAEAKIAPHAARRAAQQVVVNDAMADMQTQAGLLGLSELYDSLVLWQSRLTIAIRIYTVNALYITTMVNAWIKEKAADYTGGPEWTFHDSLVTASNINTAINELNTEFLIKAKEYFSDGEYSVLSSDDDSVSLDGYVKSEVVTRSLSDFLDIYTNNMSGVGEKTSAVIADMKVEHSKTNNKLTASFLNTYLENAQTEVASIKKNIRSNETGDVDKSTRATLTLEDTSQEDFVAYQEIIDQRRAELVVEEKRLNALKWVLKSFPTGAYSSSGNTTISGYIAGWKATTPHGFILTDTKIYDGNSNKKLKEFAAYIRPKALTAENESNAKIEVLKQQISEGGAAQGGLMDNLQEYTSSHDWNVETHTRLKHLISDIYRMYLRHGTTMRSSELSYTCILPVTTTSDNLTSAMYIKIVLSLEDIGRPQVYLSGRLLDVTDFTRDLSYRETLMQLMQGFSAGSQLVNYGSVLLVKNVNDFAKTPDRNRNDALLLSDVIREDALFINRFGSESLYLVIDNISDSTIVQHERYVHWNGRETSSLFHPGTNTRVSSSYKTMNDTFIKNYGFDPTTTTFDNPLLSNMYMVPHKYDDAWKIAIARYIAIEQTLYRVSCVIDVGDYLDQSIITKGDSTFHGDFTVKSSDNREIFQIDTLNNTSANLYPLSIGAQQPRTMLDVQDASIMDINYFITKVSKGMRELTAVYEPTTIVLGNTDDYKYKYRFNMDTKKAEDTLVVFHELYPTWGYLTYSEIMEFDKDRASIIKNSILPALQRVIDTTLFYPGSIYSTRIEFTSGMKYSVHKIVKINVPIEDAVAGGADSYNYVEAIGQGWDIQTYGINIITNPNVEKLFDNLDANIEFINFVRYRTNNTGGGPLDIPHNIQAITDKYKSIRNDVYRYDLKNVTSVLEQKVSPAEVSVIYEIAKNNNDRPIAISKLTNKEERIYHTSFIVDYTKDYDGETNRLPVGDFGIIPCRDSNYYYYAIFYKLMQTTTDTTRNESIAVFFVNMTKDHIPPSMSIEGDLAVAGELTLSGLTTRQNAASIYLTVDPENHFVGINSNDRFANYSLKHTSEALGSIYDTSQHLYVKNDRYPNATFARIAENADTTTNGRDYDATKDYTLFGTHSSATMLRSSDMWTYRETLQQAEHYTTSLTNLTTNAYNTLEDWQKKKRYGTDIAFEIKDVSGVTTELGEVQMVIDSIDAGGSLHAGFGVQVVDRTLGTIFPQALKNIMYVNNDSELFVNGVMLGGKLFKSDGVDLFWGDKKVKFEE